MIAVALSFVTGMFFGAFALMILLVVIEDRENRKGK